MYLQGEYNSWLVVLSIVISIVTSFASLNIATRLSHVVLRKKRVFWLIAGAIVMGNGIWAFHFIGMLAYHIPIQIEYNPVLTIASMLFSISASFIAYYLTMMSGRKHFRILLGGLFLGSGIILMHYVGMAAMTSHAILSYDPLYVILSIVIALIASYIALYLFIRYNKEKITFLNKLLFASIMGIAISGMHYTGMYAARFHIEEDFMVEEPAIHLGLLIGVTGTLTLILFISWAAMYFDRSMLSKMAFEDPLTQLNNRHALNDALEAMNKTDRKAVLFIDLNNFKLINDSQGHHIGDKVIIEVSQRLRKFVNQKQSLYRLGGDEFVFILDETDKEKVTILIKRILTEMKRPIRMPNLQLLVTCSLGIAIDYVEEDEPYTLVRKANEAMYIAKAEGKGTYFFYNRLMEMDAKRETRLLSDMEAGLEQGQFYIVYQPKIYIKDEALYSVEALLRWKHPQFGHVKPSEFIPLAEKTGFIVPLTLWLIEAVCKQGQYWQSTKQDIPISINVTAHLFETESFFKWFEDILNRTGFSSNLLAFEITEKVIFSDLDEIAMQLYRLRNRGVKVIMDDFGVGFSSINILDRIPLDGLKLDRLFAQHIEEGSKRSIVQAVVGLTKSLNIDIIIEGVETEKQLKRFKQLGCEIAQGYYYCEPLSPQKLEGWIQREMIKK
ncbi:MAG TPA: EAL domain-containing protein [Pseudogracilibacillus sp.]|nr:EAL domain-containing protein [Pseudogracilibacillus sp.]